MLWALMGAASAAPEAPVPVVEKPSPEWEAAVALGMPEKARIVRAWGFGEDAASVAVELEAKFRDPDAIGWITLFAEGEALGTPEDWECIDEEEDWTPCDEAVRVRLVFDNAIEPETTAIELHFGAVRMAGPSDVVDTGPGWTARKIAMEWLGRDEPEKAVPYLESLSEPDDREALAAMELEEVLASTRAMTGEAAVLGWSRLLAVYPRDARVLYGLGSALADSGALLEGEALMVRAIAREPRVLDGRLTNMLDGFGLYGLASLTAVERALLEPNDALEPAAIARMTTGWAWGAPVAYRGPIAGLLAERPRRKDVRGLVEQLEHLMTGWARATRDVEKFHRTLDGDLWTEHGRLMVALDDAELVPIAARMLADPAGLPHTTNRRQDKVRGLVAAWARR